MISVTSYTATSCLGAGNNAHRKALLSGQTGLVKEQFAGLETFVGRVANLPTELPPALADFSCRNNFLAYQGLRQDGFYEQIEALKKRYDPSRIAIIMGTSTSGIAATEDAYYAMNKAGSEVLPEAFNYGNTQNIYALGGFIAADTGITGPSLVISTACSSSAKVFASAARYIEAGLCDAALVGGVDSLCDTTVYGFNALQLVSNNICTPADANRSGLSLGEAAGFAIVERSDSGPVQLLGYGESSDAHHMSTPDPSANGAASAMQQALDRAGLSAADIGYINLHGTATPSNDGIECKAVGRVLPGVACSSSKGWTGHTLGAAGVLEAIIAMLCLENGLVPKSLNTKTPDSDIIADVGDSLCLETVEKELQHTMTNSFGFGGNNCSLLFGKVAA